MTIKFYALVPSLVQILAGLIMSACGTATSIPPAMTDPDSPDWFDIELTDVQTGETFTINDYAR